MCFTIENLDLVHQKSSSSQSPTLSGRLNVVADKLSRLGQTIRTEWSLLQKVFQAICSRWHRPQIDLFVMRFNNKLPLFVSPVPDSLATAVHALSLPWEDLDTYAFPPAAIWSKVVEKLQDSPGKRIILIAPGWPNMPWFWNLVAMSESDPSQKSDKPKSPCMVPRATSIKKQGFSGAVAARIEALQRGSIRSVYEAKWTIITSGASLIRWTSGHALSVADFLMYLLQDRNLQPSTIDGYRSAVPDNWEIYPSTSARTEISLVSWIVSTETDPKAGGAYPPGTSHWSCTS